LFGSHQRNLAWFETVKGQSGFSYLDPVKLASTIDYVLRDSYYTGRHDAKFDFRYFLSLDWSRHEARNLSDRLEALHSLHRAMDALNATYGDALRRGLTQVLIGLSERLIASGHLDIQALTDYDHFIELDDDEFLSELGNASRKACAEGDPLAERMFEVVTQLRIADLREVELSADLGEGEEEIGRERERIGAIFGVPQDRLYLMGDPFDRDVGFRMFGIDFPSYREARASDLYRNCTGLAPQSESQSRPRLIKVLIL